MTKIVAVAAMTIAVLTLGTPTPATQAASTSTQSQIQALQSRRAALVAQLDQLLPSQQGAAADLGNAEHTYYTAQGQVNGARAQLDARNAKLQSLSQQITADQTTISAAKTELAAVARGQYEAVNDQGVVNALLASKSFGQAVQQLQGATATGNRLSALQGVLADREAALVKEQADVKIEFAKATADEQALANQSNQFMAVVANRNIALSSASGPVRALESQIADIDSQIAALQQGSHPVNGGGSCGDRFSFGQCTWYVATRRCIPWSGNANQWYRNAAAMGYNEGHTPQVGAVVVFWPGGDGASGVGHVGYVEAVGPDGGVPAGEFKLSEMNFGGWDRVNYRVLPNNSGGIQGFIYGHS